MEIDTKVLTIFESGKRAGSSGSGENFSLCELLHSGYILLCKCIPFQFKELAKQ